MSESLNNNHDTEKRATQSSIAELLPHYYEVRGDRFRYQVVRSIPIDGHEVAWMRYYDENYEGYGLKCACNFAEGIGWKVDETWGTTTLSTPDQCLPKQVAVHLREQELRQEYIDALCSGEPFTDEYSLRDHITEVILDLIKKDKANGFIAEQNNGAHFWGGHFYLDTVQHITGADWDEIWNAVTQMQQNKQIQLEGMVVQEYTEPPEPHWDEYCRFAYEDYTGVALLPSHGRMEQNWQIAIFAPNGRLLAEGIEGPHVSRSPDFGPDAVDVNEVEALVRQIISGYLIDPMSQA